ncbi:unnamed protein product [Absidia cylindrospora]
MLRLSSILTLQNVWETIPPQPSKVSSPTTLSRGSSVRTKPASLLVSTTEPPPADENQEDPIPTSGSSCLPASLPAPPVSPPASVHTSTTNASSQQSVPESSTSAALSFAADAVPSIQITNDEEEQRRVTTSSMFETPTKTHPPTKKSQSSPTNATNNDTATPPTPPLPPLPPQTYPSPPPVPSKDHKSFLERKKINSHHNFSDITNINNEADDAADKIATNKSSRYHFLGPRSSAASTNSPPSSIHSSTLINGANKALRRESSKINMRRKSFSKKLKKAISNIKLNGAGETTSLHAAISN